MKGRIRILFVFAIIGMFFLIFSGGVIWDTLQNEVLKNGIVSLSFDQQYVSKVGKFTVYYPKSGSIDNISDTSVTVTHAIDESEQKNSCALQGTYEPEKQLFLSDFELPEYNAKRVTIQGRQWVYSQNPDPQWITVEDGTTYVLKSKNSEYSILFCQKVLDNLEIYSKNSE